MNKFYDLNLIKINPKVHQLTKVCILMNQKLILQLMKYYLKKFFSEPTDLEIIDKIIAGIKKTIYLFLGLYKRNFS